MDPDLDFLVEEEFKRLGDNRYCAGMRCNCGQIVFIKMPCLCPKCGEAKCYWRTLEGDVKALEDMDLGQLSNTVRMLAKKTEAYPSGETRKDLEIAIDLIYAEIGSRDHEITQAAGMMGALKRSLASDV